MSLESVVIDTGPDPTVSVIWLHGLGADGHDFEPIIPLLGLDHVGPFRFIFPHAPVIPVTINNHMSMRAWYDILEISIDRKVDEAGIRHSSTLIENLIAEQVEAGFSPDRIVLAGFSQGGALAYQVGLPHSPPLGGLLVLSAYLPLPSVVEDLAGSADRSTPILCCHGSLDPVVPISLGEKSARQVEEAGWKVQWCSYPAEHTLPMEAVTEIGNWLRELFPTS